MPLPSPYRRAPGPEDWAEGRPRAHLAARKALAAVVAVAVFIFAIALLKAGAGSVGPFVRDVVHLDGPLNAFGLGWLLAYVLLSGSPVAATALGLHAGGVLDALELFGMVAGSRFGASFIVLLIGFLYTLRKERRMHRNVGLQAGVLSLLVTFTVYGPGVLLALVLFESGVLDPLALGTPPGILDLLDQTFGAAARAVARASPHPLLVFLAGIGAVLAAFKLFDLALPDVRRRSGRLGQMAERIYRPGVMFAFGFAVTMVTLSVSVSLSLLVPLTVKGVVRRENLIPYIMGANVGTFIDTLFAAIVVGGAGAFTVILALMLGVGLFSLGLILVGYSHYEQSMDRLARGILASRARLALFLTVILICPLVLSLL